MRSLYFLLLSLFLSGCATVNRRPNENYVNSHLSVEQVKAIVTTKVKESGLEIDPAAQWSIVFQIDEKGNYWAVWISKSLREEPYWLNVQDETGKVVWVIEQAKLEIGKIEDKDRLYKIANTLRRIRYPIELEQLLREKEFAGIEFALMGSTPGGRFFSDYSVIHTPGSTGRVDIRFYYPRPKGEVGPKQVTASEIAFVDAGLNRYILGRPNQN